MPVGRRPNFYHGCAFDDEVRACTRPSSAFRLSFPSGHSSHSSCWATLLTRHLLWLADAALAARALTRRRVLLLLACTPAPVALFVAASRVHDSWHHPADVCAGVLLGALCASMVHRVRWPAPGATAQAALAAHGAQWESKPLV